MKTEPRHDFRVLEKEISAPAWKTVEKNPGRDWRLGNEAGSFTWRG